MRRCRKNSAQVHEQQREGRAAGIGDEVAHGFTHVVLDVGAAKDVGGELGEFPEDADGEGECEGKEDTPEAGERADPRLKTRQRMPTEIRRCHAAAEVHAKVQFTPPRCAQDDLMDDEHQNGCPNRAAEELEGGRDHGRVTSSPL